MNEKQFVESIFHSKAKNDSNSVDLANILNILTKTVFGDVNRFVFELLQNADDSPNKVGVPDVDVEFRLIGNFLVFKHTGKHFSNSDVEGISGVGNRASEKDKDIEKTGYKGIGFKSVFNSSDRVQIISNNFSFRFDKNFQLWDGRKDYPWQVIPIWTDDLPLPTKDIIDPKMVNTIISIADNKKLQKELNELFDDCQIVLFLRSVRNISVYIESKLTTRIEKKVMPGGVVQLIKNGKTESNWITKDFLLPVDEALRGKLERLSDEECPRKLKEAVHAKLTFAARVDGVNLVALSAAKMYCYLPTKVSLGFPFVVNADFITNAERTEFLQNEWNNFLFFEIAIKQFEWLKEFNSTNYKFQIAKLIRLKFPTPLTGGLQKEYNTGFDKAINDIAFIPQQSSSNLLKLGETIVDATSISSIYPETLITNHLRSAKHIADLQLQNSSILVQIGCREFGIEDLSGLFNQGDFHFKETELPTEIIKVISFFRSQTTSLKHPEWMQVLKETSFLVDQDGNFQSPKNLYFPLAADQKEALEFTDLRTLNEIVYSRYERDDTINWLSDLGVKHPNPIEIIRKSVTKMIAENQITLTNSKAVVAFIFKVYKLGQLSDNDFILLKDLKLNTSNGLQKSSDSYLPSKYHPQLKIDSILPNANYVLENYCDEVTQFDEWKLFFVKLGVKDTIKIVPFPSQDRITFLAYHPKYQAYFSWLDTMEHYNAIYRPYKQQHGVTNFVTVDLIEHTNQHSFSKLFWKLVLDNWATFFEKCNAITYYYRNGNTLVPSYVKYYSQNQPSIPATDGQCYPGLDIYAPQLKTLIRDHFPVADIDSKLNKEQIEFLGLKISVSFSDCFTILSSLEANSVEPDLIKQIFALYEQMIKTAPEITTEDAKAVQDWRETGKLLALNNTFQKVKDLACFSDSRFNAPANSPHFIKLPKDIKANEIEIFCSLFGVPHVTSDKLVFVPLSPTNDRGISTNLLERTKYLAIIQSHNESVDFKAVHSEMFKKVSGTNFYSTESLSLVYKDDADKIIFSTNIETWYDEKSAFYFVGKWNSPLTLHSLSSSLSKFLKINDPDREIGLLLQLEEPEIIKWLTDKGYSIPTDLTLFDEPASAPVANIEEEVEQVTEHSDLTLTVAEFDPEINVEDVDFTKVQGAKKTSGTITKLTSPSQYTVPENQAKIDIGKWSEKFMVEYFKSKPEQYQDVVWNNEQGESYLDHDISVIEGGVKKLIEVKGTTSSTKEIFPISIDEWKLMFEMGSDYSIYRLFNAGKPNAHFVALDNPAELIRKGTIVPTPINIQI